MSELKPCPFCGEENTDTGFILHKDECYLMLRYMGGHSKQEMINAWNTRPIEDGLQAKIDRRDEELLELNNDKAVFIKFENEDELPAEIKDDVYSAMFECSHVDGVRLFPYIEENGQKYFLVMLKEVV